MRISTAFPVAVHTLNARHPRPQDGLRGGIWPATVLLALSLTGVPATLAPAQDPAASDPEAAATESDQREADQPAADQAPDQEDPEARAARMIAEGEADKAAEEEAAGQEAAASQPQVEEQIDLLNLLLAGKWLMAPIGLMSFLVVTFGIERALALRRDKVLPRELFEGLEGMAADQGGLNPRRAYRLCQEHPSAASNVVKAVLLKIGRPHAEVEQSVADARDREATRLYSNVRWLTLSAGVTPLMGLLGTVWGMIEAFFVTAKLPTGANKAEALAEGIYMALVTTFAGLAVAIPAAILAHFFEGRIQKLLLELDEFLLGLLPQLERFEGRSRAVRTPGQRGQRGEDAHDKIPRAEGADDSSNDKDNNGQDAAMDAAAHHPTSPK